LLLMVAPMMPRPWSGRGQEAEARRDGGERRARVPQPDHPQVGELDPFEGRRRGGRDLGEQAGGAVRGNRENDFVGLDRWPGAELDTS
jgi:hypothetical protein